MRRVLGGLLIAMGVALATITIGSGLGYFTILSSGDDEPAEPVSVRDMAGVFAVELTLIGTGVILVRRRSSKDGAA